MGMIPEPSLLRMSPGQEGRIGSIFHSLGRWAESQGCTHTIHGDPFLQLRVVRASTPSREQRDRGQEKGERPNRKCFFQIPSTKVSYVHCVCGREGTQGGRPGNGEARGCGENSAEMWLPKQALWAETNLRDCRFPLQGKPSRSWLSIARPFKLREACTPTPPQLRHNPHENEVAFCHAGGCERLSRTLAVWILHFSHLAKATQQVRGEAHDHLGCGREPVPQLLVHIFSTSPQFSNPLHSCCDLGLKSNLRTFAR